MKKTLLGLLAISTLGAFAPNARAHVSVGGDRTLNRDIPTNEPIPMDGLSISTNTRTVSSSFGWADGTDANFGDSHRLTAFRFSLATTQTVTITVDRRNAVGQSGPVDTLLPAFSLYTTPAFVPETHDTSVPTINYLSTTFGSSVPGESFTNVNGNGGYEAGDSFTDLNGNLLWDLGESFVDTDGDGLWEAGDPFTDTNSNGFQDISLGGSGKEGAFNALGNWTILTDAALSMTFNYLADSNRADGTSANFGSASGINGDGLADGSVTGTYVLDPGTYYLFVGGATLGNQGADFTSAMGYRTYGIGLTVQAVPEPGSALLAAAGLTVLALRRKRCTSSRA